MGVTSFGKKVRDRRLKEGWSQQDLASKVGISRAYLSQIERGLATNLSWQIVQQLVTVLDMMPKEAFEGKPGWLVLPPSLSDFAARACIPTGDVEMLANIRYRGRQPSTPEQWQLLYNAIKVATTET